MTDSIFVDTSVWVEALRGRPRSTMVDLQALIDKDRVALAAPVRLEILSGASRHEFRRLSENLSALPTFYPSRETWPRIERWIENAIHSGERFGVGDLLIAAIAAEQGGRIWSRDSDFSRLSNLGLAELFDPNE